MSNEFDPTTTTAEAVLDRAPTSTFPSFLFFYRAPLVFLVLLAAMLEPLVLRKDPRRASLAAAKWTRRLLALANVRVELRGTLPQGVGLFVSNHRSYIDILVLLSHLPVTFLCKREVRSWPLIGETAASMGVVFVDRSSPQSRQASLSLVSSCVTEGRRILAFPEGTTSRAPGMRSVYPGLFREAERRGFAVFPMVLEYADPDDAWVDDDTLLRHLVYWLSKPVTRVKLSFGDPVMPDRTDNVQHQVETWMRGELLRLNDQPW